MPITQITGKNYAVSKPAYAFVARNSFHNSLRLCTVQLGCLW